MTKQHYLGLMSGTSADGLDIALLTFDDTPSQPQHFSVSAFDVVPYPADLRENILALYHQAPNELERLAMLDKQLAYFYAQAIEQFLAKHQLACSTIKAIGNHGQTIRHRPNVAYPFSMQIGCNQTLACLTGIRVVGRFREKDIALGGQGAPLAPIFHQQLFHQPQQHVFVLNLGGIANITYLPPNNNDTIIGFDTGPANALLDDWFCLHHPDTQRHYDTNGQWAASGRIIPALLAQCLADDYFALMPPKSTGREYFNLAWLRSKLQPHYAPEDVQATLTALTAYSIANDLLKISTQGQLVIMGGGAHNNQLKNLLIQQLTDYDIVHNYSSGISEDSLEAALFAWLAYAYDKKIYGNIPSVTGASKQTVLGCAFAP
jgi:anhydro-N-acetylmuramic acid kinase